MSQERYRLKSALPSRPWSIEQYKRFLRNHTVGTHQGVILCDLRRPAARASIEDWFVNIFRYPTAYDSHNAADIFVPWTLQALKLVEHYDERRFRRIQRYIEFIVNTASDSPASYSEATRVCEVDLSYFKFQEKVDWSCVWYAGIFVHEATHGLIAARGIPYTKHARLRIEQLCHQEEQRFLRRIDPWWAENSPELDEGWLKEYWRHWEASAKRGSAPTKP